MIIGLRERLIEWRNERGWSQAEVVRRLNRDGHKIINQSYSHYEVGRNRPSRETCIAICRLYGKTLDQLLMDDTGDVSDRVRNVWNLMRKIPDEDQALIESLVQNLYQTRVLDQGTKKKSP